MSHLWVGDCCYWHATCLLMWWCSSLDLQFLLINIWPAPVKPWGVKILSKVLMNGLRCLEAEHTNDTDLYQNTQACHFHWGAVHLVSWCMTVCEWVSVCVCVCVCVCVWKRKRKGESVNEPSIAALKQGYSRLWEPVLLKLCCQLACKWTSHKTKVNPCSLQNICSSFNVGCCVVKCSECLQRRCMCLDKT